MTVSWPVVLSELDRLQRQVRELSEETAMLRRRLAEALTERDDWRSRSEWS